MPWPWLLVIILIIILAGILIYLALWSQVNTSQTDSTQFVIPLPEPVGLLYRCANLECDTGLACDSTYGVCKLPIGSLCDRGSQCLTGLMCSGVCTQGTPAAVTGQPNSPCPCPVNMTCTSFSLGNPLRTCKLNAGQPCEQSPDCLSNACQNNLCSPGAPDGSPCQADTDCFNSNCSLGWCQSPGEITGQAGAVCTLDGNPSCDAGVSCLVTGPGQAGICGQPELGLASSCTVDDPQNMCSQPLFCNNVNTGADCVLGQPCMCQYHFTPGGGGFQPDPNGCVSTCTDGFTCTSGACRGQMGQACTANTQCVNSTCGGSGVIYQAVFTYYDLNAEAILSSTTPSLALGSFTVAWQAVNTGLLSNVTRITYNIGNAGEDVLYYVIPGSAGSPLTTGVLKASDNSNLAPGFISNSGGTFTLKDAALNTTQPLSLLVYRQVSGTTSGDVIYDLTGQPYNPTAGSGFPGTQYAGGTPLTISSFDVNSSGDVIILDDDGVLYVKPAGQSFYLQARDNQGVVLPTVSSARFYTDISQSVTVTDCSVCPTTSCNTTTLICTLNSPSYANVGYVATNPDYGEVLQFTGNIEGSLYPVFDPTRGGGTGTPVKYNVLNFSSYSDPIGGITSGTFIILATSQFNFETNVFLTPGGGVQPVPGYVDATSLTLGSTSALYLYSENSCLS